MDAIIFPNKIDWFQRGVLGFWGVQDCRWLLGLDVGLALWIAAVVVWLLWRVGPNSTWSINVGTPTGQFTWTQGSTASAFEPPWTRYRKTTTHPEDSTHNKGRGGERDTRQVQTPHGTPRPWPGPIANCDRTQRPMPPQCINIPHQGWGIRIWKAPDQDPDPECSSYDNRIQTGSLWPCHFDRSES